MRIKMDNQDILTKYGLNSDHEFEVGSTQTVHGMITKIITDNPGEILVEINFSIKAYLNLSTVEKIEMIKARAFDLGFFVTTTLANDEDGVILDCHTIVYGKSRGFDS